MMISDIGLLFFGHPVLLSIRICRVMLFI